MPKIDGFEEFWKAYPKKVGKKECREYWIKNNLYEKKEVIIADTIARAANHATWLEGYIKHPIRHLKGEHWTDEIELQTQNRRNQHAGNQGNTGRKQNSFSRVSNKLAAEYEAALQREALQDGGSLFIEHLGGEKH